MAFETFLRFRSDSRDVVKSEKDLRGLERQAGRTEKSASRLGRTLGRAFAGLSAGLVFRQIIKNTAEQEKAVAQLNATLQSTGRFTEQTSQALQDYAESLQQVTTFSDEAIVAAESQLLTFKSLGSEVFPRATEAVLDLSAKLGQSLKTSVLQLGKALEDPLTGLSRLTLSGISFSKAQKDMVKELVESNRLLDAQKLILDEVESQFGGSAKAARDTFPGAMKAAQNAIGDLLEGDGEGLKGATQALNDLTDLLNSQEVKDGFAAVTTGALNAVAALAQLPGVIGFVSDEIRQFFGIVDDDDFERRSEQIAEMVKDLELVRRQAANFGSEDGNIFAQQAKDLEALIQKKREDLEADRIASVNRPQPPSPVPDLSGLDGDPLAPIVVNAEKREKDLAEIMARIQREIQDKGQRAAEGLARTLNDLAAQQGGPSAEAAQRLAETMLMLNEQQNLLAQAGQLTLEKEQQLASARALATQQFEEQIAAIEAEEAARAAQLTVAEQLIEDLEFEKELLGLTNEEREKAIALRYAEVDAASAQGQAITRLLTSIQQEREVIQTLDDIRGAAANEVADFIGGFQSAGDALDDFLDRMRRVAAQVIAEKLIESILGGFGSSQSGSVGGFFKSLFGAGRALGGPVFPNTFHQVVERGDPEILSIGNKDFLLTGNQGGKVTPISKTTTNNQRTNVQVNITRPINRLTAGQIGTQTALSIRRAQARNA